MNILHINRSDVLDGAAIAAYRLHQALASQNFNSRLLVGKTTINDCRIAKIPDRFPLFNKLHHRTWYLGLNYLTILNSFDIPQHSFYQEADILNFHNILGGYFNYLAVPYLTREKPAIVTLHDMWYFTGHCAYSYDCERWRTGCGQCPYPRVYPDILLDNTQIEWKLKNWVYNRAKLTIVAPSTWLLKQAEQSILSRFPIYHIPNGIDTTVYQPLDPVQCRSLLGIPPGKIALMFVALGLDDQRKGGDLLFQALQSLPNSLKSEIVLLIMGNGGHTISTALNISTINLGYVSSDRLKSIAFSAAHLFVFPTRADNLPLVLQESLACGTPIVSFKVGGVSELVRPGVTGYLAEPENIADLLNGIIQLIEDKKLREQMEENCRSIAVQEYSSELQAKRYIELYSQIIQKWI
jgi:glycosyltransferase involved in cell wall biosynthesis